MFNEVDEDGNGSLDPPELRALLRKLFPAAAGSGGVTDTEVRVFQTLLDRDGDGKAGPYASLLYQLNSSALARWRVARRNDGLT